MMKKILLLFSLVFSFFCLAQQAAIPFLKYEQLEERIASEKDRLLVVNFWSTTCAPCVKELPHFMEVNDEFKNNPNYKMLLVSLDRPKDLEKVQKFLAEKNITAEVVILDDIKRMNTWIPRIEQDWMGEIPVTVFYKNGEKLLFHNGELSRETLKKTIIKHLN